MRGIGSAGYVQRVFARLVGVGLLDPAIFHQAIDHVIAALDRPVAVSHRMQRRRCLRQCGEVSRFRDRKLIHRLVEIHQRCRGHAVSAKTEINLVEIEFENFVLGIGPLDPHRQQGFLDLAGERHFVGQKKVLRDLLGNSGGALRTPVRAIILGVEHGRARHAGKVDPAVLVEILVLRRQERVDHHFRDRLDWQIQSAFLGIFAEQRAVRSMDARHHWRLIILKLRIIRQVP